MHLTYQLLTSFYEAFQRKDYATMQASIADHGVVGDAVFQNPKAVPTRTM